MYSFHDLHVTVFTRGYIVREGKVELWFKNDILCIKIYRREGQVDSVRYVDTGDGSSK